MTTDLTTKESKAAFLLERGWKLWTKANLWQPPDLKHAAYRLDDAYRVARSDERKESNAERV